MANQTSPPPATKPDPAPTAPTSELAALRAENESLRQELAATGARVQQAQHTFQLSEGARQELLTNGYTTVDGVRRTRDEIEGMLSEDQDDVDLGTTEPTDGFRAPGERSAVRGVDFVYPSIKPGFIDPAVAGTPGINGPAADPDKK